jgi:hypothetical protein
MMALVFTGDWVEAIELVIVVGAAVTGAKILFCHQEGCYRLGRFRHGHYKLCAAHHPKVPSDGKINEKHIKEVK